MILFFVGCKTSEENTLNENQSRLIPIPFNEVSLDDNFWKPRLKTQTETLVLFALDKTIKARRSFRTGRKFFSWY